MRDVALVLSSGGARGLAHIGAIEELEAQGYRIRSIVGCSMGAIIGGMYAAGKLAEYKVWMQKKEKKKILSLLDISFSLDHLVKGEKIIEAMKEIVPDVKIEDLPIPFKAVATDWEKGQEVVFSKGSLYEAIRASISMPLFFDPVKKGGTTFVDGGILNPLPLNISKDMPGDIVVAVNVSGTGEDNDNDTPPNWEGTGKGLNYFTMSQRLFRLMVQKNAALNIELYKPDILVNIPMDLFGPFEYDHVDKISAYGRKKMREALQFIDNVSPCILWIDEIEKVLATTDSGNETGKRVLGEFLFWIQESDSKVFMVATANNVELLPYELYRKGRFSEVFFADLPSERERADTFRQYIKRSLHRDPEEQLIQKLVGLSKGFSYADIETAVKNVAQDLLNEISKYGTVRDPESIQEKLIECTGDIIPISTINPDMVRKIREWGMQRARKVSSAEED